MAFFCEAALAASESVKFTIPGRLPGLNDMTDKEATMVMILPRQEQYVNIHQYCFHLWETIDRIPGEWG